RRKLLLTLAPGKRQKQEPITPHSMPAGTQDGRNDRVHQDSGRPGWPGMVNNRVGFVHRLALVYLAQLGPCSGQISPSHGGLSQARSAERCSRIQTLPPQRLMKPEHCAPKRTTRYLA